MTKSPVRRLIEKFEKCNGQLILEDLEDALLMEKSYLMEFFAEGAMQYIVNYPDRKALELGKAEDCYENKFGELWQ